MARPANQKTSTPLQQIEKECFEYADALLPEMARLYAASHYIGKFEELCTEHKVPIDRSVALLRLHTKFKDRIVNIRNGYNSRTERINEVSMARYNILGKYQSSAWLTPGQTVTALGNDGFFSFRIISATGPTDSEVILFFGERTSTNSRYSEKYILPLNLLRTYRSDAIVNNRQNYESFKIRDSEAEWCIPNDVLFLYFKPRMYVIDDTYKPCGIVNLEFNYIKKWLHTIKAPSNMVNHTLTICARSGVLQWIANDKIHILNVGLLGTRQSEAEDEDIEEKWRTYEADANCTAILSFVLDKDAPVTKVPTCIDTKGIPISPIHPRHSMNSRPEQKRTQWSNQHTDEKQQKDITHVYTGNPPNNTTYDGDTGNMNKLCNTLLTFGDTANANRIRSKLVSRPKTGTKTQSSAGQPTQFMMQRSQRFAKDSIHWNLTNATTNPSQNLPAISSTINGYNDNGSYRNYNDSNEYNNNGSYGNYNENSNNPPNGGDDPYDSDNDDGDNGEESDDNNHNNNGNDHNRNNRANQLPPHTINQWQRSYMVQHKTKLKFNPKSDLKGVFFKDTRNNGTKLVEIIQEFSEKMDLFEIEEGLKGKLFFNYCLQRSICKEIIADPECDKNSILSIYDWLVKRFDIRMDVNRAIRNVLVQRYRAKEKIVDFKRRIWKKLNEMDRAKKLYMQWNTNQGPCPDIPSNKVIYHFVRACLGNIRGFLPHLDPIESNQCPDLTMNTGREYTATRMDIKRLLSNAELVEKKHYPYNKLQTSDCRFRTDNKLYPYGDDVKHWIDYYPYEKHKGFNGKVDSGRGRRDWQHRNANNRRHDTTNPQNTVFRNKQRAPYCTFCRREGHKLINCRKATKKDVLKLAREGNLCLKCLRKGHRQSDCRTNRNEWWNGFSNERQLNQNTTDIKCYHCNLKGHRRAQCEYQFIRKSIQTDKTCNFEANGRCKFNERCKMIHKSDLRTTTMDKIRKYLKIRKDNKGGNARQLYQNGVNNESIDELQYRSDESEWSREQDSHKASVYVQKSCVSSYEEKDSEQYIPSKGNGTFSNHTNTGYDVSVTDGYEDDDTDKQCGLTEKAMEKIHALQRKIKDIKENPTSRISKRRRRSLAHKESRKRRNVVLNMKEPRNELDQYDTNSKNYRGFSQDQIPKDEKAILNICGTVNDKKRILSKLDVLLDWGSTINTINKSDAEKLCSTLNIKIEKGTQFLVENGHEERTTFSGDYIAINVQIPNQKTYTKLKFFVMPHDNCSYGAILSRYGMKRLNYSVGLKFHDNEVIFEHNSARKQPNPNWITPAEKIKKKLRMNDWSGELYNVVEKEKKGIQLNLKSEKNGALRGANKTEDAPRGMRAELLKCPNCERGINVCKINLHQRLLTNDCNGSDELSSDDDDEDGSRPHLE